MKNTSQFPPVDEEDVDEPSLSWLCSLSPLHISAVRSHHHTGPGLWPRFPCDAGRRPGRTGLGAPLWLQGEGLRVP